MTTICILSEKKYGCGASNAAYRLASSLSEKGINVHFIHNSSKHNTSKSKINFYNVNLDFWQKQIDKFPYIPRTLKLRIKLYFNFIKIKQIVNIIKPDVINIHNISNVISREHITIFSKEYPIVWTMHDCWSIFDYNYKYINYCKKLIKTFAVPPGVSKPNSVDKLLNCNGNIVFVCPSKWLLDITRNKISKYNKKALLIPYIVNNNDFYPENKTKSKEKLGLSSDKLQILFVSSLLGYERKNINLLINTIPKVSNIPLEFNALGNSTEELKQKLEGLNISVLKHTTSTKVLRTIYSAADIFIICSFIDNLPNTVLESLLCETPVLGANVGGIPEMVFPGINGWLFNPYDANDLIQTLYQISNNKRILKKLQSNCRKSVLENFNSEDITHKYMSLFDSLKQEI